MEKNNEINTIESPLILRWSNCSAQYKVNKPLDQSGEYVSKSIADKIKADNTLLLDALKIIHKGLVKANNGKLSIDLLIYLENKATEAIKKAEAK